MGVFKVVNITMKHNATWLHFWVFKIIFFSADPSLRNWVLNIPSLLLNILKIFSNKSQKSITLFKFTIVKIKKISTPEKKLNNY